MDNIIPQDTPLKQCTGPCGQFFPATIEYFHRHQGGFHPRCKQCRSAEKKAIYAIPEEKEKKRKRAKSYRDANKEQGKAHAKAYYESHKEEAKAYHQAHRQKRIEYNKARYKAHKEQSSERRKAYYKSHQEQEKEYQRAYIKANPIQNRKSVHVYKARKRGNGGKYTTVQIEEQLKRQKYKCYYAGCGYAKFKIVSEKYIYHIEHVVPISRGGSNDISNIVLACPSCNDRKKNKLPSEWPEGGRLF